MIIDVFGYDSGLSNRQYIDSICELIMNILLDNRLVLIGLGLAYLTKGMEHRWIAGYITGFVACLAGWIISEMEKAPN
jgi:hypothetical protein